MHDDQMKFAKYKDFEEKSGVECLSDLLTYPCVHIDPWRPTAGQHTKFEIEQTPWTY